MRSEKVYTPQNVISLVVVFFIIFWLLYNLASFWHESRKIHDEIDAIRVQNQQNLQDIEDKKRRLEYLKTSQHIDKEAKMQMGKKQPGENVLVFIEEKLDILPPQVQNQAREQIIREEVPILDKWKWLFLGKK